MEIIFSDVLNQTKSSLTNTDTLYICITFDTPFHCFAYGFATIPRGQTFCVISVHYSRAMFTAITTLQLGPAVNKEFQKQLATFTASIYHAAKHL